MEPGLQLFSIIMANSRAGKRILLKEEILTSTSSSILLTKALDMLNTYSEIVVLCNITATATMSILMKLSGLTDYNSTYIMTNATVVTGVITDAGSSAILMPIAIYTNPLLANIEIHIRLIHAGGGMAYHWTAGNPDEGNCVGNGRTMGTLLSISSIEILPSTSTFAANSMVQIFGVTK